MPNVSVRAADLGLPASHRHIAAPAERQDLCAVQTGELRRTFDFDANDLPELYVMSISGHCLTPVIADGTKIVISSIEKPQVGDFAIFYKRPEILEPGEFQAIVKRLVTAIPDWVTLPYDDHPQSTARPIVIAEQLNPRGSYHIPCSALVAIHKVVGTVPEHMVTYKPGDAEIVRMGREQKAARQAREARS